MPDRIAPRLIFQHFWSSEQTSVVRLVDPEDVLDKMVYALTNPVKNGLVTRAHHWPGVSSLDALLHGGLLRASKPKHFFRDEGCMPDTVTLTLGRPRGFDHLSASELTTVVLERIAKVEERMEAERKVSGRSVLGRRAVLSQSWRDRPDKREPRRTLDPRVAARNKWSRIEALMRNATFRDAYVIARATFVAGVRDVVFPAGTYWLRRFANAICEPAPAPA